jgi:hypothetical protein
MNPLKPESEYTFPLVRQLPDTDDQRNTSITVERWPCVEFTQEPGFRVSVSHECWTGAQWLPMFQAEETPTFEDAVALAKELVEQFSS